MACIVIDRYLVSKKDCGLYFDVIVGPEIFQTGPVFGKDLGFRLFKINTCPGYLSAGYSHGSRCGRIVLICSGETV